MKRRKVFLKYFVVYYYIYTIIRIRGFSQTATPLTNIFNPFHFIGTSKIKSSSYPIIHKDLFLYRKLSNSRPKMDTI